MQHVSKEDFNKKYEKINCDRQKEMDWNNYNLTINDTTFNKTYIVQNDTDVRQISQLFYKFTKSKSSILNSTNFNLLYDPYDLNHIHGLRKY